jgi:MoxR-like ATPase
MMTSIPKSIDETSVLLKANGYVAGRDLATVVFLALKMGRPLFLEGEAGVGKTEVAKVLAAGLGRKLIRLQCYEGLDINSRPQADGAGYFCRKVFDQAGAAAGP